MPMEVITQSEKKDQDAGGGCFLVAGLVIALPVYVYPLALIAFSFEFPVEKVYAFFSGVEGHLGLVMAGLSGIISGILTIYIIIKFLILINKIEYRLRSIFWLGYGTLSVFLSLSGVGQKQILAVLALHMDAFNMVLNDKILYSVLMGLALGGWSYWAGRKRSAYRQHREK